jgi:hypothetical protein
VYIEGWKREQAVYGSSQGCIEGLKEDGNRICM